ncbi:hypothetical protein QJS10_CPA03g01920 [Acorus calamus]|uniref:Uncharacterized protein n=1 Tax=Acorus calamus TaxID=4465 RepID=A0AAV9F761_ACOCL|nr:hypothetical protein QJS10_CPA03g01920 [Acorus calamus]
MATAGSYGGGGGNVRRQRRGRRNRQFPVLEVLLAALRRSLVVTCGVEGDDVDAMDIGWPTDVRHVAHVTFDRFRGFLGLPDELEPDVSCRAPSASVSVFGVSAKSMQCSHDQRGNSVPTILLLMQRRLYSQGGLQAEGIFRINAENSQELYARDQLNKGVVPQGVDLHCLAGLIKVGGKQRDDNDTAWFRELPTGVLDPITPDQVLHCNTEDECFQLAMTLPPTEAALLDWAINLMADVVQREHYNKMNARNIAMVFAPNMTQTLREREDASSDLKAFQSCSESTGKKCDPDLLKLTEGVVDERRMDALVDDRPLVAYSFSSSKDRLDSDTDDGFRSVKKNKRDGHGGFILGDSSPTNSDRDAVSGYKNAYGKGDLEGRLDKLSLKKGVRKLCRKPIFHSSKSTKKSDDIGNVNPRMEERKTCA